MELYIAYRRAAEVLAERGIRIERSLVGNFITSLEMQGFSRSLLKLDDEMLALWDAPVHHRRVAVGPVGAPRWGWTSPGRSTGSDAAPRSMAEHRVELITLDREIGDGDHGENMDRGFQAVLPNSTTCPPGRRRRRC